MTTAFLGELIAGVGTVATAVAPVVSAYQAVSSLFRPAIQRPPTPHAFFGGGFTDWTFQQQRYWGMPRFRWQTPTVRAYAAAQHVNPTYVPMKTDWLGGDRDWH